MSVPWRSWGIWEWNKRLLPHFFGATRAGDEEPITRLVVTAEELARATGDPSAEPEEAREVFTNALRTHLRKGNMSLCADGLDYSGWNPSQYDLEPPFVSNLIATCLAASDSSEELIDEDSFLRRLNTVCGDHVAAHEPSCLPKLWTDLGAWLRTARHHGEPFRELLLPDPGGFTRIGYTVNLAFPHRRDQRELVKLLGERGLAGIEPPVPTVLLLLSQNRQAFSERFRKVLHDFRDQYARGAERLDSHPLWRAVRDAALWARGTDDRLERITTRFGLLLDVPFKFEPFVVATCAEVSEFPELRARPSVDPYGQWTHLVESVQIEPDGDGLDEARRLLLAGRLRLPGLGSLVDQGVLLFERGQFGPHELCQRGAVSEADCALVRGDLVNEFVRLYGRARSTWVDESIFPGWKEARGFRARPLKEGDSESLGTIWCLQETIPPPRIRVVGGVRVDDGFLGNPVVLPYVDVAGAEDVVMEGNVSSITPLARSQEDARRWRFPEAALQGSYRLVARTGDAEIAEASVRFYEEVVLTAYKGPHEPTSWIGESGTTDMISADSDVRPGDVTTEVATGDDMLDMVEPVLHLGPGVGDLTTEPVPGFEWRAWRHDSKWVLFFAGNFAAPTWPIERVGHPGSARLWRRIFTTAELVGDSRSTPLRDEYVRLARSRQPLERAGRACVAARDTEPPRGGDVVPEVEAFETVVAALGCRRQGIDRAELLDVAEQVLGVTEWRLKWDVLRAWVEVGCLDLLVNRGWHDQRFFPRRPRLAILLAGERLRATLIGLCTRTVRQHVEREARDLGIEIRLGRTQSPFVPTLLRLDSDSVDHLFELSRRCDLAPMQWIRPFHQCVAPIEAVCSGKLQPPLNYRLRGRWDWRRQGFYSQADGDHVSVEWYWRSDAPEYFLVAERGHARWWSYSRNWALLCGYVLRGEFPYEPFGSHELRRRAELAVHLPLPVGRLTAAVGNHSPGPSPDGGGWSYSYAFPTRRMRDWILGRLRALDRETEGAEE